MTKSGFWLTDDSVPAAEIAAALGYDFVLIDVEHGMFDLATLERYIPLAIALGLEVFAKTLSPHQAPIQQVLDFGCTGVVIPHVGDLDHARTVTSFTKYPPRGKRSITSQRNTGWGTVTDETLAAGDARTLSFPLIEEADALDDIERIVELDTVDGVMIGQTDLSASRGRGMFARTEADLVDLERIVAAVQAVGKPWIFAAWAPIDLDWAFERGASHVILGTQYDALLSGARTALEAFEIREK